MDFTQLVIFIFVFFIINLPIYMQFYNVYLKYKKGWQIIGFSLLYWIGTIFTENFFPFLIVIFLIKNYHIPLERNDYFGDKDVWSINWVTIFNVAIATLGLKIFLTFFNAVFIFILNYFLEYDLTPQEAVVDFSRSGPFIRIVLFFLIVVFAPFVEEYVFRHFLYGKVFLDRMPSGFAAVLSAIVFTIAHYNISGIPSFFGLALFCTYIYEKEGYFPAVAAHISFNLSAIVFLLFMKA